jgi:hypothetical protein
MDFGELLRALRRNWIVFGVLLVVAFVGIAAVAVKGPSKYQSTVQLTMLNGPKINDVAGTDGNPYLSLDSGALATDVSLLTTNLSSAAAIKQLAALGVTETLTAAPSANATGPFIELTVEGPDKAHILQSMQTYISFTKQSWLQLQTSAGAPAGTIVSLQVIADPSPPTLALKSKAEMVGATGILLLVIAVVVPSMIESRRRRRRPKSAVSPEIMPRWPVATQDSLISADTDVLPALTDQMLREIESRSRIREMDSRPGIADIESRPGFGDLGSGPDFGDLDSASDFDDVDSASDFDEVDGVPALGADDTALRAGEEDIAVSESVADLPAAADGLIDDHDGTASAEEPDRVSPVVHSQ